MLKQMSTAPAITEQIKIRRGEKDQVRKLRRLIEQGKAKLLAADGDEVELPATVQDVLLLILKHLQSGKAISIVAEHQQLSTQRAANILGVSRPFLVGILERGTIPFHMVGAHRRIYLRDLLCYKRDRDAARHEAVNRMAKTELEAGTYDKIVLPDGAEEE
jgi:excisionase family DNA binding protein